MVLIYSKIGKMLLAWRYRNDFLLLLLWWFPLGDTEQRKSTLAVVGKIQKSLLGQRTQVVKQFSSSGSIQYNSIVNSAYLTAPSFMLLQCLTPHATGHVTMYFWQTTEKKTESNPLPSINWELLQKAIWGIFFLQEIPILSRIQGCL